VFNATFNNISVMAVSYIGGGLKIKQNFDNLNKYQIESVL
jgi:hypothetical protein